MSCKDMRRIRKILLKEDKAYDRLNDEQFPGLIFARLTIYRTEPVLFDKETVFEKYKKLRQNSEEYTLLVHLYQGKELPAGDKTGASDPFVIARCCG